MSSENQTSPVPFFIVFHPWELSVTHGKGAFLAYTRGEREAQCTLKSRSFPCLHFILQGPNLGIGKIPFKKPFCVVFTTQLEVVNTGNLGSAHALSPAPPLDRSSNSL